MARKSASPEVAEPDPIPFEEAAEDAEPDLDFDTVHDDEPAEDVDTQYLPEDVPPEFEYDPSPADVYLHDDEEGTPAATTEQGTDQVTPGDPWGDDPATFDFRTIRDLDERTAAYQRFAREYPDLAMQRDMLYEDYQTKTTEVAQQRRELAQLRENLARLEGRVEERGETRTAAEQDELDEATAQLYAWGQQFTARHGRDPSIGEIVNYATQARLEPVLGELQELKGQREAEMQRTRAEQERMVSEEWVQVTHSYPHLANPAAEEEVAGVLAGIASQRGGTLKAGDVKRAVQIAFGEEIAVRREQLARQAQAQRAAAVPATQPSGASPSPTAGPRTTSLDDIEKHQRKRGIRGLIADLRAARE